MADINNTIIQQYNNTFIYVMLGPRTLLRIRYFLLECSNLSSKLVLTSYNVQIVMLKTLLASAADS